MFLREVRIEGFRCFKSAIFTFQEGFNAIVGRNNTGKTTLFQAMRHALGSSANRGESLWLTEEDFHRDPITGTKTDKIEVRLLFGGLNEDDLARFFDILDYNTANPENSDARVVFEASWNQGKPRPDIKRWGGASTGDRASIAPEILAQLPVTFLPALRDAEAALTPGNKSRLALLLQDLARRDPSNPSENIVAIFKKANEDLEKEYLIKKVRDSLQSSTGKMAGSDYSPCSISASEPKFERILRTLRVQMLGVAVEDIGANGLGYNNLLYIATVLAHLEQISDADTPLLLVEEPEAHLHPQLTVLLAEYLNLLSEQKRAPQVLVTTHSPTLAAHLRPSRVSITFFDASSRTFRCNGIIHAGLTPAEERELRRMLDVTRATLYFAKGLILVEGISEALLLPVVAKRLGCELLDRHVSVIPICGVAFATLKKILNENVLNIPVSIVTDGDPGKTNKDWELAEPRKAGDKFEQSDRTVRLVEEFRDKVFPSQVTLEYDMAAARLGNAQVMTDIWQKCFRGQPRTLNQVKLDEAGGELEKQALVVWRGICVSDSAGSKAEFANLLADALDEQTDDRNYRTAFEFPKYLRDAIESVWNALPPPEQPVTPETIGPTV